MTFAISAVAAVIAFAQNPVPVTSGPISLEQAADIAARNAFAVRLQASRAEQAHQRVQESRAGLFPRITASASETRLPASQVASVGGGSVVISPSQSRTLSGSIQFPIDLFGNTQRQIGANSANERASRETLIATQNDARLNAKTAYFGVLRAEAAVGVAAQAAADAKERLDQARLLLKGDQVAQVDVVRLESQYDAAVADKAVADNTLQLQKNAFNVALARPVETPVEIVPLSELPALSTDPGTLVTVATGNRPEVRAFRRSLEALANTRRALEGGLNPSLTFGVNYQRNLDVGAFAQKEQTTVSLNMSIPIFDGGATRARVKAARQDELQAKINLEQVELSISQEVRNAVTSLANAKVRLASAESQVKAAETVYRLAKVRQDAGEGTYVEVVDAFTSLVSARNTAVSARFDYLVAYSQLQRAVGADNLAATPATASGS